MYWNIALIHVQTLKERCQKDLASDNYEGVITKSRTMLEEVFIYVIGEEYDRREYKGNIGKMFLTLKVASKLYQILLVDIAYAGT